MKLIFFSPFLAALTFLTRIPTFQKTKFDLAEIHKSTIYFPLVGALVGSLVAGTYFLVNFFFNHDTAIWFSLAVAVGVTGALHEDGLADTVDGLVAGKSREDKLRIMKDSHIGTYGVLALIFIVGLKFLLLKNFDPKEIFQVFVVSHTLSRWIFLPQLAFFSLIQNQNSKSQIYHKSVTSQRLLAGTLLTVLILMMIGISWIPLMIFTFITSIILGVLFQRHLGGLTGDCFGFSQQVIETSLYFFLFHLNI